MPGLNSDRPRGRGIGLLQFVRQVPGRGRGQPIVFPQGRPQVWNNLTEINKPDDKLEEIDR